MKSQHRIAILLVGLISLLLPQQNAARVHRQQLDQGWEFRQERSKQWRGATVPGTVHTDLMAHGLIPDPYIRQNERMVQWVDKEDWRYRTTFDLDLQSRSKERHELVFDGLDTYADVYLNDSLVLKADNMHRRWRVDVSPLLRPVGNELEVYFHSPLKIDIPKFEALPYELDAGNDQSQNGGIFGKRVSVFARKAGYHYGWDWGPRLVTSGIWRPVYLESSGGAQLRDVYLRTDSLSSDGSRARLIAVAEIESPYDVKAAKIEIATPADGISHRVPVELHKGLNRVETEFEVANPRLWWSRGMGKPELYHFDVSLRTADNQTADSKIVTTGIRSIELVNEADSAGRSFYFRLNGRPVFAKGANWIPADIFLPRVDTAKYRRLLGDAAEANMNMIRVWGGGVYEDDKFYRLCDSLGLMVWQDFMFACSLYPSEGALMDNIREEARDNIRRLRNHPSIVLWCGNNECHEAWYNWGWRRWYEREGVADTIWRQFTDLYHNVLPEAVAENAPCTPYRPSSPYSRIDGSPEPDKGDFHLWRVWGGGEPVDLYNHFRARFFSEYGFQSFPEYSTVLRYAPDTATHFVDSDVMMAHQRAPGESNRKIEDYILQTYPQWGDFEEFLYLSQLQQADAIRTAIEAHRRDMPYCMGSLYWQLDDCWPVASWSSTDYYGKRKQLYYAAARAFKPVMISPRQSGDTLRLYVVSDSVADISGQLRLTVGSLDGSRAKTMTLPARVAANSVAVIDMPVSELESAYSMSRSYIHAALESGDGRVVAERSYLPLPEKDMELPQADVKMAVESAGPGRYIVRLRCDRFVRAFTLTIDGSDDYRLSDNGFDLLPGREYVIECLLPAEGRGFDILGLSARWVGGRS